jgi:hypothetical protein
MMIEASNSVRIRNPKRRRMYNHISPNSFENGKWQMANGKKRLTDFCAGMVCGSTGVSLVNVNGFNG